MVYIMNGLLSTDTGSSTEVVVDPNVNLGDKINDHDKRKINNTYIAIAFV